MRVLGMISGTSHDGVDLAAVNFRVDSANRLIASIDYADSIPYPAPLRAALISALPPAGIGFEQMCKLDTRIGRAFAEAAVQALSLFRPSEPVDVICTHGQTVYHWVERKKAYGTLQIGQPAWLAEATGLPVISDVRSADVAAGGEGAPLVPLLDQVLLASRRESGLRCGALNLGGISNITICKPGADTQAWDIGPANALVDAVVTESTNGMHTYDRDGELARRGQVDGELLELLLHEPYYALLPPKSSGKELFNYGYVKAALAKIGRFVRLEDLVATLSELTAVTVADTINTEKLDYMIASGGGTHNPVIMGRIRELAPNTVIEPSDAIGIPGDAKEAIAFALIGWATMHGLPANVPSCTGASGSRVLGRITPAPFGARNNRKGGGALTGGFPPITPLSHWPRSLRFVDVSERTR